MFVAFILTVAFITQGTEGWVLGSFSWTPAPAPSTTFVASSTTPAPPRAVAPPHGPSSLPSNEEGDDHDQILKEPPNDDDDDNTNNNDDDDAAGPPRPPSARPGRALPNHGPGVRQQQTSPPPTSPTPAKPTYPTHEIVAFAKTHSFLANEGRPTVIVTVATYSYKEMLLNWLGALRALNYSVETQVVVLCASRNETLRTFLWERAGVTCYQTNWTVGGDSATSRLENPGFVWKRRIQLLAALLDAGLDVVMSDVDAVWLRDPLAPRADLFSPKRADVVAGRGEYPFFVSNALGATVCMGTAFFASNERTTELVKLAVHYTMESADDQYGFNAALMSLLPDRYTLPFSSKRKIAFDGVNEAIGVFRLPSVGNGGSGKPGTSASSSNVRVLYASHQAIPRFCDRLTDQEFQDLVFIAHCHLHDGKPSSTSLRGSASAHHAVMTRYKLFVVAPTTSSSDSSSSSSSSKLSESPSESASG